jgi:hypothetical protein
MCNFGTNEKLLFTINTFLCVPKLLLCRYGTDDPTSGNTLYNETEFIGAWSMLLLAVELEPALADTPTFTHDLADVTRQAVAKHSSKIYRALANAVAKNSSSGVRAAGTALLLAIDDVDDILHTSSGFLFGQWLAAARNLGTTDDERTMSVTGFTFGCGQYLTSIRSDLRLRSSFQRSHQCAMGCGCGDICCHGTILLPLLSVPRKQAKKCTRGEI